MKGDFIRVTKNSEILWTVLHGPRDLCLLRFKFKSHAIAYARAISFSGKLALFVDDEHGTAIRQSPASLTYPVFLS